jgi:sugar (pentulose or hexulose) kinase
VGTLRPELARATGLTQAVKVLAGLHDSNAALLAARGFDEIAGKEATILSTGTWFVAMRLPGRSSPANTLPEGRDCLINVDVHGAPVPSARFMGGREIEQLGMRIDLAGTDGLADVLLSGAMLLPSQIRGCGPFPDSFGRWINMPADAAEQRAAIALYAALMADASLDLIGANSRLLIEGRFANSEIFVRALATLRPDMQVFTASADADVSFGALRLLVPDAAPRGELVPVEPLDRDLNSYRDDWYDAIEVFS